MPTIKFFVPGIPATAGSKKPFLFRSKKDGKIHASMAPDNKRQKPWMEMIRQAALDNFKLTPILSPVLLTLRFDMPRPKAHYGTGKNADKLKDSAPILHTNKPDLSKMVRAVEDALKGIVWRDDSQVALSINSKKYTNITPGVFIKIQWED